MKPFKRLRLIYRLVTSRKCTSDAASIASALEGIGPAKAKEIVAYREMFGSFRTLDELLEVPGVGAVTLEKNLSRILIQGN